MLIFIPTSLIHNQSEVHAEPNENDIGWQLVWHSSWFCYASLYTFVRVWVRRDLLLSLTALLSLGGKHKIQGTANWDHVLSIWWEKVLVQSRAHRDGSLSSSFPRCHRQMQKNKTGGNITTLLLFTDERCKPWLIIMVWWPLFDYYSESDLWMHNISVLYLLSADTRFILKCD